MSFDCSSVETLEYTKHCKQPHLLEGSWSQHSMGVADSQARPTSLNPPPGGLAGLRGAVWPCFVADVVATGSLRRSRWPLDVRLDVEGVPYPVFGHLRRVRMQQSKVYASFPLPDLVFPAPVLCRCASKTHNRPAHLVKPPKRRMPPRQPDEQLPGMFHYPPRHIYQRESYTFQPLLLQRVR